MSAYVNREIREFMILFRDTWTECQALRAKERLEASGHMANWEECLRAAQTEAQELFQPIFSGLDRDAPLPPIFEQVQERLEASRN
jgi:hypothetical protein